MLAVLEGCDNELNGVLSIVSSDQCFAGKIAKRLLALKVSGAPRNCLSSLPGHVEFLVNEEKKKQASYSLVML